MTLTHPQPVERAQQITAASSLCVSRPPAQAIPAGGEVLISYLGEKPAKSSTELMKDYGFVLPGNTNDTLSFTTAGGTGNPVNAPQLACCHASRQSSRHTAQLSASASSCVFHNASCCCHMTLAAARTLL